MDKFLKTKILIILIILVVLFSISSNFEKNNVLAQVASISYKFTKSLYRGIKNDEVRALQEFLKQSPEIYPEGLVTGYFGPLTEAAVKKLQEKYGIETVGIVGPKTRQKLNELFVAQQKITKIDEKTVKPEEKKEVLPTPAPDITKPVPPLVTPVKPMPSPTPKISACGNQICEVDETSESCQSDCAISLNNCMAVLKNGDSSKKLDLVFLADSFPASKLAHFVTDIVPVYSGIREGSRGILAREPFKSAKAKFNIWAIPIAEIFDCAKINCHRSWLGGETYTRLMIALSRCQFDFDEVVVVKYAPSIGKIFGFIGEKFTYEYYTPNDWLQAKNNNADILLHEFAHSFAKFNDDYGGMKSFNSSDMPYQGGTNEMVGCDTAGCPRWCSGTPRYSYKDYAPECFGLNETNCKNKDSCVWIPDFITQEFQNKINPYYSGTSCVAQRSDKDNGINCLAETGCYQGCGGGHANWWRSANRSIMTGDYSEEFSGYHKKIINEALMKYE
ncbi:MAG: peptidoglycan-binding protein [Candidatus Magasanikbacteria bacterium]|nr:peptidoglycan-binding protein [Candidatus Magasanikbacteria bacterium]